MAGLESTLIKANGALKRGDADTARTLYEEALARYPRNKRLRLALDQLDTGNDAQLALDKMVAAYKAGEMADAARIGEALCRTHPGKHAIHNLRGAALLQLGDLAAARDAFQCARDLAPGDAACTNNLGITLSRMGEKEAAEQLYREAVAINPAYIDARYNLAHVLQERGHDEQAEAAYNECLAMAPDHADAHYNFGNLLAAQKRHEEALAQFREAARVRPDHADTHNNMGAELQALHQPDEAVAAYDRALALQPDDTKVLLNRGKAQVSTGALPDAISSFRTVLRHEPLNAEAHLHALFQEAHICDWHGRGEFDHLPPSQLGSLQPFAAFPFADDPARQLAHAKAHAAKVFPVVTATAPTPAPSSDGRIRIGYFSADFHDHATMYLMAGLLREHDRSRFAIHAYSYGPPREGDAMRAHARAQCDSFTEIGNLSDAQVAEKARADELDIAVDLKGYTRFTRSGMFGHRLAPVQVNYLGYPGSLGHPAMDYLIADPVTTPAGYEQYFTEKLVRLPNCYQPNDDQRAIIADIRSRADHGLPEQGFVFCSFNHTYKIGPQEFDIWMRLLGEIEGSVLWLLRSNQWAEGNLAREAAERGIDPARIVFAPDLPHNEHLGRLTHADLFLDSFAVNAHTSASDALWAGLPVLTMAGRQFLSRVAASLVTAAGVPDLATSDAAEYEAKALELATDAEAMAQIRQQLAAGRTQAPLFRSAPYARQLEAAFAGMHQRQVAGLAPDHMTID
ncbi:tetratricopeptide repeat protein [Aurantiacibacter suaedae]|uniref:O-linked N-acetylglucosamine transferase, SPINDLY family protein n=1 Tax=Aurantiacibacter suaedae TaxID=2545755 RepID=UPI001386F5B5|nr:tetratricopeptide repeat protein [Aurantiacibacter suaedae]